MAYLRAPSVLVLVAAQLLLVEGTSFSAVPRSSTREAAEPAFALGGRRLQSSSLPPPPPPPPSDTSTYGRPDGQFCTAASQCRNGFCIASTTLPGLQCSSTPYPPGSQPIGASCTMGSQCASRWCVASSICSGTTTTSPSMPSCTGACVSPLFPDGHTCGANPECVSFNCYNSTWPGASGHGQCRPVGYQLSTRLVPDHSLCFGHLDCVSNNCVDTFTTDPLARDNGDWRTRYECRPAPGFFNPPPPPPPPPPQDRFKNRRRPAPDRAQRTTRKETHGRVSAHTAAGSREATGTTLATASAAALTAAALAAAALATPALAATAALAAATAEGTKVPVQ